MRRTLVALVLLALVTPALARAQAAAGQGPSGAPGTGLPGPMSDVEQRLTGVGAPGEVGASALSSLPGRNAIPLSGPVNAEIYRLGPGDLLLLTMGGRVSRSVPVEVSPEGTIMLPDVGTMLVGGRTIQSVRDEVLTVLRAQYRGVSLDFRLARPRSFVVYLTGEVRDPGAIVANGTQRIGDVLWAARLSSGASRRRIEVRHRDGTTEIGDLDRFFLTGDSSFNPWVRDGDVIQVPVATEFVWVQGAIARPALFELGLSDSLLTLLRLAGDPLPSAEVERVLLIRFKDAVSPESLWVNLEDVYAGRTNPPVSDGERIYVYYLPHYHLQDEAVVLGEVQRPGIYPIREGQTHLSDLVAAAGGFQRAADLSAIRVHRRSPAGREADPELERLLRLSRNDLTATEYEVLRTKLAEVQGVFRVDWSRLLADRDLDLYMRHGDSVLVERLVSSVRVDGEVRRPGILTYTPGQSVAECVRRAGGYTDRAWRGKVRVTRAVTGQILLARNVRTLDPGDFVWVPEKPDVTVWQQAKEVLLAVTSVATIIIAIRSLR